MYMDSEGMTLASEILAELKASARRWFIAFLVMLGIEIATVCGFLWYISLPMEETSVTQEADNASYNQVVGGDYNGGETDSNTQAQSSQE